MTVGAICTRDVVVMRRDESLATAAQEMCKHRVGTIVVIEDHGGAAFPIGIVTDRDIVLAQLQHQSDLFHLQAVQVMTKNPLYLNENESISSAVERLQTHAVRRAPVVNDSGALIGILSVDDLIGGIAAQIGALAKLIERQQHDPRMR
jgi:CBS domain-containing protein